MFAAILGSLVLGTLASKVGENIVGKRLGMSEKDRKLLGTVFGMAGGAYGGYAGSAGFGSSGIGASGSAGGMGGQSPKVGGDYGTAMNLFSQPTVPGAGPGYYGSGPVGNVSNTGYQYMPAMGTEYTPIDEYSGVTGPVTVKAGPGYYGQQPVGQTGFNNVDLMGGQGYASQYDQLAGMPAESYGMDSFRINEYDQMAGMPARSYGMDMYAARPGNEMFSIGRPDNTWVNPNSTNYMDSSAFLDSRPTPLYQGPSGGNVSAQTYALDSPSRTIGLAPSGTPLEVIDASAYTPTPETFYGVDPNSPTASGSNLGMESVYNSGGNPDIELVPSTGDGYLISPDDQVRLIQANPDGTFTELPANTDLSTKQGVEEFINMDEIRIQEMEGGLLDPFGTGPNITAANYSVSGQPQSIGSYIENGPIVDNSLNADPRNIYANKMQSAFLEPPRDSIGRPILSDGIKAQARYDAPVELFDPQGTQEGLTQATEAYKFDAEFGRTAEEIQATAQEKIAKAREKLAEGGKRGDNRVIEREQQNIADTVDKVRANKAEELAKDPSKLDEFLSKIPEAVKKWAAETGIALLDMWIQQELFGQDYDDQIAEASGGGGGGVLRGSSPVVSPYSGGGSGGGGKGVLFSMGGSGQQGRGTHIMALQ